MGGTVKGAYESKVENISAMQSVERVLTKNVFQPEKECVSQVMHRAINLNCTF